MKKQLFLALVGFASMVMAREPWEKTGAGQLGRQPGEQVGVTYTYNRDGVVFDASWGTAHNNQMLTYERKDKDTGWKYSNGTFMFTSDYVWTDFASRQDVRNEPLASIVEFGYYKIVDGVPQEMHAISVNDGDTKIENSVIFQKDDTIGFYMKTKETQTVETGHYEHTVTTGKGRNKKTETYTSDSKDYYMKDGRVVNNFNKGVWVVESSVAVDETKTFTTTSVSDDYETFVNNVDTDSRGLDNQYFCLFQEKIDGISHYEYFLSGVLSIGEHQTFEDFLEDVAKENDGKTTITNSDGESFSGQPLPGMMISLALGFGTIMTVGRMRKKK